jgi:spermidine synthase
VLDGKVQSSAVDEFIYHEALVQPAMVTHPGPEVVFIAGGGEGATLREVLSHNTVKRAVMVDIDEEVVALSKKYFTRSQSGCFLKISEPNYTMLMPGIIWLNLKRNLKFR